MSHNINNNLFTDDWAVCGYHGFGINWYRVVLMSHQTVSLGKYWKLFSATLWLYYFIYQVLHTPFSTGREGIDDDDMKMT